jgi:hypothetical protein
MQGGLVDDVFGDPGVPSERIETALDVEVEAGVRQNSTPHSLIEA